MKFLQIVVGICLILAVAWAVLLRARRGTESMAALRKFRYAHRGLYDKEAGIPENSLPAFSRAIARGFGAELDVHLLRDGTLAVFHDSDVKRMTGREGYLEDLSADELKDYALDGTKETIPQFKDVLALFAGTGLPLIVEVKSFRDNFAELFHDIIERVRLGLAAHQKFNTGIFAFDVRHNLATAGRGNRISHYTDKSSGRSEISFSRLPCTKVSSVSTASSEPASLTARISS